HDREPRSRVYRARSAARAGAAEPHEHVVLRRIERLEPGRLHEFRPLVVAEPPDVAAALQVVVHGAQIVGSVAVRDEAAARSDQNRQMLDADRALVLAGAARRALPEDVLRIDRAELGLARPGEQCGLRLQDDRLRVERLAGAPRGTVHLAAPALHARERVEPHLAREVLHSLEPYL